MSLDDAQTIIAALCLNHKTFRPRGEPTLTPHGARIEIMQPKVSPATVAQWFVDAGVTPTLVGVKDVYARVPTLLVEFRL